MPIQEGAVMQHASSPASCSSEGPAPPRLRAGCAGAAAAGVRASTGPAGSRPAGLCVCLRCAAAWASASQLLPAPHRGLPVVHMQPAPPAVARSRGRHSSRCRPTLLLHRSPFLPRDMRQRCAACRAAAAAAAAVLPLRSAALYARAARGPEQVPPPPRSPHVLAA